MENKIKIGVVCICLNPPYWQFSQEMLWGLNTFFLKHPSIRDKYETELMVWTDMPHVNCTHCGSNKFGGKIFNIEPMEWPMPTLMRYHLFLQQEDYLKKFDYIFYIDVDMRIVDWIGEEIMGDGLTAAQHPMYALRQNYQPPYEPNPSSTAFIPRPGRIIDENGNLKLEQLYYAGGFQGGKTDKFIEAMKVMRKAIDDDQFNQNYIARWNDESHWNRYLYDNPPVIVLDPGYIYPDSLVGNAVWPSTGQDYYIKLWGRNYSPKIMTLTKSFSTTKEGGAAVQQLMAI